MSAENSVASHAFNGLARNLGLWLESHGPHMFIAFMSLLGGGALYMMATRFSRFALLLMGLMVAVEAAMLFAFSKSA